MKIALITGASSGIGREFARTLDQRGYDELWVLARRKERLEELGSCCQTRIRPLPLDLTKPENFHTLHTLFSTERPEILTLVNASGFGLFGAFTERDLEGQLEMVELNIKALTALTYMALPYMANNGEIYELGSLSAFQPVPYLGVYAATKAYVLSFSRALNLELQKQKRNIRALAVCPGWVKTEFFSRAQKENTLTYFNRFFSPEEIIRRALRDMKKGKDVSVCGASIRLQVFFSKILPHPLVMRIWCKQQKK